MFSFRNARNNFQSDTDSYFRQTFSIFSSCVSRLGGDRLRKRHALIGRTTDPPRQSQHAPCSWGLNASGQLGLGDTDDRGDEEGSMGNSLPSVEVGMRVSWPESVATYSGTSEEATTTVDDESSGGGDLDEASLGVRAFPCPLTWSLDGLQRSR